MREVCRGRRGTLGIPFPAPKQSGLVEECGQVGGVADAKTS